MGSIKLWLHKAGRHGCSDDTPSLPTFYMNDWSELALRVSDLQPAIDLLRHEGVEIDPTPSGTLLRFTSLGQIPHMVEQLNARGIKADMSDRVNRLYQG